MKMRRTITVIALIVSMLTVSTVPSCTGKDGDPTGPAIFIATVLLLGITVGGWFDKDNDDPFPPNKYDVLPRYGNGQLEASILTQLEEDWYRTEYMYQGEVFEVWAESPMGIRAVLVDENGRYYNSDNAPGTDFHFKIRAEQNTSYYIQVFTHDREVTGPYDLYWKYSN
jgi:hypothetical protein